MKGGKMKKFIFLFLVFSIFIVGCQLEDDVSNVTSPEIEEIDEGFEELDDLDDLLNEAEDDFGLDGLDRIELG